MPFTPEQTKAIKDALTAKGVVATCPACGQHVFHLVPEPVVLMLQQQPRTMLSLGGPALPCFVVICTNCGDSRLFNAFVLGLAEVVGMKPGEVKPAEQAAPAEVKGVENG
jgi:uncharacterized protein (DUF983 family)